MQDLQTGHLLVSLLKTVLLQHKSTATCENTLGAGINPSCNIPKQSEDAHATADLSAEVKAAYPSVLAAEWAQTDLCVVQCLHC